MVIQVGLPNLIWINILVRLIAKHAITYFFQNGRHLLRRAPIDIKMFINKSVFVYTFIGAHFDVDVAFKWYLGIIFIFKRSEALYG